jgi:hypothetical protein
MSDTALRPAAAGPVQPSAGHLQPLGLAEVRITGGFWGEKQYVNRTAVLDHCRTWMERIGWIPNFDHAAHGDVATERRGVEFVDSEVYKLLEAMAWELARRHDHELEVEYRSLVARVVAAQEPDGYLHTAFGRPGQRDRYSDMEWGHELYCFGHLMQAAVARLRAGHDDALPAAASRLAEHVAREFGPEGRDAICGHPEIELGLVELGRATGERRWVDLAALFVERRGRRRLRTTLFQGSDYFLDDVPVREAVVLRGHAVRAVYLAAGAVDVAVETGDGDLLTAVERQWTNTVARRTYITGGLGAHHQNEAIGDDFELPADRAYAETCAAIGSVMLSHRLLLATGEARYADLIERTLLNAVLVGPSEDGRAFYYANTLHQREVGEPVEGDGLSERAEAGVRAPWFEVSCCPTNVARTLASVAGYFATRDADGVQLHQYGDYDLDTMLEDGRRVHLRVRSEYPFDGRVEVEVLDDVEATLTLRVPAWAHGATLEGEPSKVVEGGRSVRRGFVAGDRLVLRLPMDVRAVRPDPRIDAVRGSGAFEQGPLVLSLESTDLPDGVDLNDVAVQVVETDEQGSPTAVLRSAPVPDGAWPYASRFPDVRGESIRASLRPYFRWGSAGPAAMRVWIPEAR